MQEHAQNLLRDAPVHSSLSEALADCVTAVAFTRRRGVDRFESANVVAVSDLADLGERLALDSSGHGSGDATAKKVALVFGNEVNGLRSSEVLQCTHICEIATSAVQGSMSLPSAATFALGRTFEEALATESARLPDSGAAPRPLGGDVTNLRAARHRRQPTGGALGRRAGPQCGDGARDAAGARGLPREMGKAGGRRGSGQQG